MGRQLSEGVCPRARRDTRAYCLSFWGLFLEVLLGGVGAAVGAALVAPPDTSTLLKIAVAGLAAVVGFFSVAVVAFGVFLLVTPVRQRDEAREFARAEAERLDKIRAAELETAKTAWDERQRDLQDEIATLTQRLDERRARLRSVCLLIADELAENRELLEQAGRDRFYSQLPIPATRWNESNAVIAEWPEHEEKRQMVLRVYLNLHSLNKRIGDRDPVDVGLGAAYPVEDADRLSDLALDLRRAEGTLREIGHSALRQVG